jgi:hypothetical protein
MSRTVGWCFTINLNSEEDRDWDPHFFDFESNPSIVYLICQLEVGENGTTHWQGYLHLSRATRCLGAKKALFCQWAHLEPRKGTVDQAIEYCEKVDSCAGEDYRFVVGVRPSSVSGGSKNADVHYRAALACQTYEEAMRTLSERSPRDFVIYNSTITKFFKHYFARNSDIVPRDITTFRLGRIDMETLTSRAIVISGGSGFGKTAWAIAHFKSPLICSHIEDLKKLSSQYDGVVFDDMSFSHYPASSCIHLVDLEYDRSINVRWGIVTLPKSLPRMFTTNLHFENYFSSNCTGEQFVAISRRCKTFIVESKLF